MSIDAERDSFFGWFYEHPEAWADHETVARFSESCRKYRDYVNQLDGDVGKRLKSVATQWVLNSDNSRIHDSRIIGISINVDDSDHASKIGMTLALARRDGSVLKVCYASVTRMDLPPFQALIEWGRVHDHELLLGSGDGANHIVHNIHFARRAPWVIFASDVTFNEIDTLV